MTAGWSPPPGPIAGGTSEPGAGGAGGIGEPTSSLRGVRTT
jgi:hypothetical protein